MEQYNFNLSPLNHQPSGFVDVSKLTAPKNGILTYTNLNTREKEVIRLTRTNITDKNGIKKFTYILPSHFVKK